jgi:hypothetical protein
MRRESTIRTKGAAPKTQRIRHEPTTPCKAPGCPFRAIGTTGFCAKHQEAT